MVLHTCLLNLDIGNFRHDRQDDSHVFVRKLLEKMEDSYFRCNVPTVGLDFWSRRTNPIGQIFGGMMRVEG